MSSCTSSSKRVNKTVRRTYLAKDRDYISNLPECVLSHILSCLTAKEAVRTCVLSRNWERNWTSIYNIDINDSELYKEKSSKFLELKSTETNFSNFVERLLLVVQNAKKFVLSCKEEHESSRVISWICTILRRKVENLEVECLYQDGSITLPPHILSCTSLRKLKLKLYSNFTIPVKSSLPRLSDLYLYHVEIQNGNPQVDTLSFTFPLLKTFELEECTWLNVNLVDINAPKLTTFKCVAAKSSYYTINDYTIKITADRVAKFESYGAHRCFPENISVIGLLTCALLDKGFELLDKEGFDIADPQKLELSEAHVLNLLKGISSSEHLVLGDCTKALWHSKREVPLPVCHKLQRLTLSYGIKAEVLVALLTAATCLKYLDASVRNMDDYDYDQVKPLPECLLLLEEVKLNFFTGTTAQLNLVKFLLKNGIVLKKVHLSCPSRHCDKDKIDEQLSAFPKRSACLMLTVAYSRLEDRKYMCSLGYGPFCQCSCAQPAR